MNRKAPPKPVLVTQHARHEHPATILRALETQGIRTKWVHPYLGDPYPVLKEIAGIISLGGPMGANDSDEHPWIAEECELLAKCVREGLPAVGICLGGQMMARGLGAVVEKNTSIEVGWLPIVLNNVGQKDPIIGAMKPSFPVYHWHEDTFHLPQGAQLLARSDHCPRQAFRIGDHAYGFQFHPEVDHQLIQEWLAVDGIQHEIEHLKRTHPDTVQDIETQILHSKEAEDWSIRIASAIGTLFKAPDDPDPQYSKAEIERCILEEIQVTAAFSTPRGSTAKLKGVFRTQFKANGIEMAVFLEETGVLWPIRIKDLKKVTFHSTNGRSKPQPRQKR